MYGQAPHRRPWIPAFAGMTGWGFRASVRSVGAYFARNMEF